MNRSSTIKHLTADIEEDMVFQRRQWLFERIMQGIMALFIVGAVIGIFGDGIISKMTAKNDTMSVSYDRFARQSAPTSFTLTLPPDGNVVISQSFLAQYNIQSIEPEPDTITFTNGYVHYGYTTTMKDSNKEIVFRLQSDSPGILTSYFGDEEKGGITISQIVYP